MPVLLHSATSSEVMRIAGEHEEDVDAEQSAAEPGHSGMESEHTDHGDGADAVESGHVGP